MRQLQVQLRAGSSAHGPATQLATVWQAASDDNLSYLLATLFPRSGYDDRAREPGAGGGVKATSPAQTELPSAVVDKQAEATPERGW